MLIRSISPNDDKPLAAIIRKVFREFAIDRPGTVYTDPTTDHLYSTFNEPGALYWVAENEGILVGGCGIYPTKGLDVGCAELVKFYMKAEARGKGIGRMLMLQCFVSAKQMGYRHLYLETLPELSRAVSMYEKVGFKHIPKRMDDSGHFSCYIWMMKDLYGC